jgi:hypothetical protein
MSRRTFCYFLLGCIASIASLAQIVAPPVPQRLVVHSNVLNEDRVIWCGCQLRRRGRRKATPCSI